MDKVFEDLQERKRKGWKALKILKCPEEKANIFLKDIIFSYYYLAVKYLEKNQLYKTFLRKIAAKDYFPGYELDYNLYVRHWLHANDHLMDKETYQFFISKIAKPLKSIYLPYGHTIYVERDRENDSTEKKQISYKRIIPLKKDCPHERKEKSKESDGRIQRRQIAFRI